MVFEPKDCLIQKSSKNTGTETSNITVKANKTPFAFSILGFGIFQFWFEVSYYFAYANGWVNPVRVLS